MLHDYDYLNLTHARCCECGILAHKIDYCSNMLQYATKLVDTLKGMTPCIQSMNDLAIHAW